MSLRNGAGRRRFSVALLLLALCLVFSSAVAAQEDPTAGVLEERATFPVTDPPDAPYHAHQSMLLFVPGAMATLHRHGGPGYITVLDGELTLFEDGVENHYQAGQSLVETPDTLYKGGNFGDQDLVLMVTYLIPEGEEVTTRVEDPESPVPPEFTPEALAETMHEFEDPPSSFELVHDIRMFQPEAELDSVTAGGDTLLTVVAGSLTAEIDGSEQSLQAGEVVLVSAGQEYTLRNDEGSDALVMSSELVPDSYSMVPDAGSPVDRTAAIWLMIMVGGAIMVIGAVIRLTVVRLR